MKLFNKVISIFKNVDKSYYMIFLGMLYTTLFFASFILGYKVVDFYGRIFCASVFIFPLLFPINDSISELFGVKITYFMIIATILCEFLFSFMTYSIALMPSPNNWPHQEIYPILTSGFTHIAIADSISLALSFFLNSYFINKWGIKLSGKGFFLRSLGATAIGELVFTISTNLIAFNSFHVAGYIDTANIILSDYLFKMAYSIVICIPNAIIVNKIKKSYDLNQYKKTPHASNVIDISSLNLNYRV